MIGDSLVDRQPDSLVHSLLVARLLLLLTDCSTCRLTASLVGGLLLRLLETRRCCRDHLQSVIDSSSLSMRRSLSFVRRFVRSSSTLGQCHWWILKLCNLENQCYSQLRNPDFGTLHPQGQDLGVVIFIELPLGCSQALFYLSSP